MRLLPRRTAKKGPPGLTVLPEAPRHANHVLMAMAGLTSRGRAFLAAGVTAAAAGIVLDQRDLVRIGILLLALPVTAAVFLTRARYRISAHRNLDRGRAQVGSVIRVEVAMRNLSRMTTPLLLAQDALPAQLGAAAGDGARFVLNRIPAGGQSSVTYSIRPVQRGRYLVGPLSVRLADPFGFCQILRTFAATSALSVLPAIVPLRAGRLGGQWSEGGDSRQHGITTGGEQDATTRPYVSGDDRRRVHWRTTARTGELAVRREEQPWQSQATILIDTREHAHSPGDPSASFEFAVSAAASIASTLIRAGFGLRLVDDAARILADSASTPSEAGFGVMDVLADLPRKTSSTLLPVANRLSGLSNHRQEGGSIIAVLGVMSTGDASALSRAVGGGGRCMALLVDADSWIRPAAASGSGSGSGSGSDVFTNRDILQRAGWSVAVATPQTLLETLWHELNTARPMSLRRWAG